jgi:hypothetical protein
MGKKEVNFFKNQILALFLELKRDEGIINE